MPDIGFGLWMTVMGMGTVFALLFLLLGVLWIVGWFDQRSIRAAAEKAAAQPQVIIDSDDEFTATEIAALTAVVLAHRKTKRPRSVPIRRVFEPGSHLFASRWVDVGRSYQHEPFRRK
jgi:sodium pump decarboxylase gamma subunit